MKNLASLGISLALVCAVIGVRSVRPVGVVAQSRAAFEVEEASIASIHAAITSGQTTCRDVVQTYIDRAKAYNGVCTALVTPDGADVAPTTGYVRTGAADLTVWQLARERHCMLVTRERSGARM